jgi:hypothetical protein
MARGQGSVGAWEGRRKGGRVGRREGGERKSRSMEQFVIPNQPQEMPLLGEAMEGGSEGGRERKKVKERKKGASENYIWTKRLHPCLPIPTIYSFSNREGLHVPHPTIPPYASAGWKLNLQDHKKFSGACTEITRGRIVKKKNSPSWAPYNRRLYLACDPDFPRLPRLDSMLCLVGRFAHPDVAEPFPLLEMGA